MTGPHRGWVGRSYAHVALPVAYLNEQEASLFDEAVCAGTPDWTVEPGADDPPLLHRRWQSPRGGLVLVVLGWYPAIVTVGAERSATRPVRRALHRMVAAARRRGGRTIADHELEQYVAACQQRWRVVAAAYATLATARSRLTSRRCPACPAVSAFDERRCRGCGRRFRAADDLQRDAQARAATQEVTRGEAEIAALARGAGLLDRPDAARGSRRAVR